MFAEMVQERHTVSQWFLGDLRLTFDLLMHSSVLNPAQRPPWPSG